MHFNLDILIKLLEFYLKFFSTMTNQPRSRAQLQSYLVMITYFSILLAVFGAY